MKRFLLLTGIFFIFLCFSSNVSAQKSKSYKIGATKSFKNEIPKHKGKDFILQATKNQKFKIETKVAKKSFKDSVVIGKVKDHPDGTFFLKYSGNDVKGNLILRKEKKAYEYYTEKGQIKVKEVDINSVLCVEYGYKNKSISSPIPSSDPQSAPPAGDPIYTLESFPGAEAVIYLDFDGETISETLWDNGGTIEALPAPYSEEDIRTIYNIMVEDLMPYQVNITTNRTVFDNAPLNKRMHTIFTPTNYFRLGAGGVAYVGSFSWSDLTPCWVFTSMVSPAENAGEAASHEVGHTLGLSHDGRTIPSEGYYYGHGDWAPIMGVAYDRSINQWSKGEYPNANNTQDDLEIISTRIPYVVDEDMNSSTSARFIMLNADGTLTNDNNGIISTSTDQDWFKIILEDQAAVDLTISPNSQFPNLHITSKIYGPDGQTLLNSATATGTNPASLSAKIGPGTFYLMIDGAGEGSLSTGYSDYGSLGYYSISGSIKTCGNNFEPNETYQSAAEIPLNSTINASITSSTDVDYYKIVVPTAGWDISLLLKDLSANLDLELLNSSGYLVDIYKGRSSYNNLLEEKISYQVPSPGTYYIKVYGRNGVTTASCYTLENEFFENTCPGANEPNENFSEATLLSPNNSVQGAINTAWDRDYYKFPNLPAGTLIKVNLTGLSVDLDMQMYNEQGNYVAYSGKYYPYDENITYVTPAEGTYYLRIYGWRNAYSRHCYTLSNDITLPCENAYEPNQWSSQAAKIPLNSTVSAEFTQGERYDYDWYKVEIPESGSFSVTLSGATAQYALAIYSPSFASLVNDNYYLSSDKTLEYQVQEPGTYYIRAVNFSIPFGIGCYSLTTNFIGECQPMEPNNTLSNAIQQDLNSYLKSNFDSNTDQDYYKYNITERGQLHFTLSELNVPSLISIINPSGTEIYRDDNLTLANKEAKVVAPQPGEYVVLISPLDNTLPNPDECYKLENKFIEMPIDLSANSLKFDGTEKVAMADPNNKFYISTSNEEFTLEVIVKSDLVVFPGYINRNDSPNEAVLACATVGTLHINRSEDLTTEDLIGFYTVGGYISYPFNLKDGNCHHLAIVKTASEVSLYIDGVQVNQNSTYSSTQWYTEPHPFLIGAAKYDEAYSTFNRFFKGSIKEVRYWNTARSAIQIQNNINSGLAGNETGLIAYWPLNEGSGQTFHDRVLSKNADGHLGISYNNGTYDPSWTNTTCSGNQSLRLANATHFEHVNNTLENIRVYPNPFVDELRYVIHENSEEPYEVTLKNSLGITIYHRSNVESGFEHSIKEVVTEGYYTLEIKNGSNKKIVKVLKL